MSGNHESHAFDNVGTYNENCPDCNNVWMKAVRAVIDLHGKSRGIAGTFCRHCRLMDGTAPMWPCDTIKALGNVPDLRPAPQQFVHKICKGDAVTACGVVVGLAGKGIKVETSWSDTECPDCLETYVKPGEGGLTRCRNKQYPSSQDRCGYFLIGGLCVRHGRDTGL